MITKIHLASALCGMSNLGLQLPGLEHDCWKEVYRSNKDIGSIRLAVYLLGMTVTTQEDELELIYDEARSWYRRLRDGSYGFPSSLEKYKDIVQ